MREILFRGKCVGNGKWVYGHYIVGRISGYPMIDDMARGEYIDPATLGQFTGLCDKNGKKVFEGDVLKISRKMDGMGTYYEPPLEYPVKVAVKWDMCAWMWETIEQDKYYIHFPDAWCHFGCEVVGNIHDNPELLKGDTNAEND